MKNVLLLMMLLLSLNLSAQEAEYTFENRGINLFVDIDGTANKHFALGGPSITVGYQFDPHWFLGATGSMKFGDSRPAPHKEYQWMSPEGNKVWGYYVNNSGDTLSNPFNDYCDDCGDMFFGLGNWDIQMNVRYNFLAYSRWTPYVDFRIGTGYLETVDGYNFTSNIMLGNRFALSNCDRAINIALGYSMINFTTDNLGFQGSFMFRLGMEF